MEYRKTWTLAAATLLRATAAQMSACVEYSFTDTFEGGNFQDNWVQKSGIETGNISVGPNNSGLRMSINTQNASATQIASKLLWTYGTEMTVVFQPADQVGVMSDLCIWPPENKPGLGEIDLEILGGTSKTQIMVPIWQPGNAQTPIRYANAPSEWYPAASADHPNIDFGDAAPLQGVSDWVDFKGFDKTQLHSYTVKYGANEISYSVDGQVFVNYTKGSNDAYWPGNGPMSLNIAMWQDTARKGWMGEFVYDPNNPPVYYIQSVSIKGCVTNLDSANATAPSSVVDGSSAIPINQPTSISGLSSLVTASQTAHSKSFTAPPANSASSKASASADHPAGSGSQATVSGAASATTLITSTRLSTVIDDESPHASTSRTSPNLTPGESSGSRMSVQLLTVMLAFILGAIFA